jgi:hypothetical protein
MVENHQYKLELIKYWNTYRVIRILLLLTVIIFTLLVIPVQADISSPVILGHDNQLIEQGAIGNIIWTINDTNPNKYWIKRNDTMVVPPTIYQNNTEINIPIDTSAMGLWCYTLFADDRSGNIASSQVNIIVQETSPLTILFPPNNYETTSTSICINGTVEGIGQEPSVIIINDKGYMEMADLNITNGFTGTYSGSIPLDYGTNKITVTAIYSQNNSESIEIMVIRTNNTKPLCGGGGGGDSENTQLNNYVFSKHYIVIAH